MKIGIIVAMDKELAQLQSLFTNAKKKPITKKISLLVKSVIMISFCKNVVSEKLTLRLEQ